MFTKIPINNNLIYRISDLMLYKLEYKGQIPVDVTPSQAILEDDRELKRFKTSEDDDNDTELSLYSMMSPKLIFIDRLHINGPIEDTLIYSNSYLLIYNL